MSSTARQELYECFTYNGTQFFVGPSDSMKAVGSLDIVPGWCVRVLKAAKDGTFSTPTMIVVDISVPLDGMSGEHGTLKVLTPSPIQRHSQMRRQISALSRPGWFYI